MPRTQTTKSKPDGAADKTPGDLFQAGVAQAMMTPQTAMRTGAQTGAEIAEFIARRMHAHADFWTELGQCRDPGDIFRLQATFLQTMGRDYSGEAATLVNASARMHPMAHLTETEKGDNRAGKT